jgi:hypothetical protein
MGLLRKVGMPEHKIRVNQSLITGTADITIIFQSNPFGGGTEFFTATITGNGAEMSNHSCFGDAAFTGIGCWHGQVPPLLAKRFYRNRTNSYAKNAPGRQWK